MPDQPAEPVDLDDLRNVSALRRKVDELESDVTELRAAMIRAARSAGISWREIGEAFDVSPQRAHEMARLNPKQGDSPE